MPPKRKTFKDKPAEKQAEKQSEPADKVPLVPEIPQEKSTPEQQAPPVTKPTSPLSSIPLAKLQQTIQPSQKIVLQPA